MVDIQNVGLEAVQSVDVLVVCIDSVRILVAGFYVVGTVIARRHSTMLHLKHKIRYSLHEGKVSV